LLPASDGQASLYYYTEVVQVLASKTSCRYHILVLNFLDNGILVLTENDLLGPQYNSTVPGKNMQLMTICRRNRGAPAVSRINKVFIYPRPSIVSKLLSCHHPRSTTLLS
jgi:hypothetical protein